MVRASRMGPFAFAFKLHQRVRAMGERFEPSHSIRGIGVLVLSCAILAIVLTVALTDSWSKDIFQNQPSRASQFEIKSSVNEVLLHMTVRDSDGNLVGQLNKDNFRIYEDGVLQQIDSFSHEDIPVTVGLVVDNSGSMKPKRPEVIASTLAFVRSSNSQDEMFVVNFNDAVSFGLSRNTPFTDQQDQLKLALSSTEASGRTALYDAISYAVGHLKQGSHDKKALIVVSDGGDNASKNSLSETMALAVRSDAIIYTIGLFDLDDHDRNPHVLKELAKATGGDAFLPESTKDVQEICERIALEIRNQYTVTYVSSNRRQDGSHRSIKVRMNAPDHGHLMVRARSGYYAPSNTESRRESQAPHYESAN
jgi:Ca-activated chloride channel family protein